MAGGVEGTSGLSYPGRPSASIVPPRFPGKPPTLLFDGPPPTERSSKPEPVSILVIEAGEIHSFRCIGDGPLVQLDVHLSPRFVQENLTSTP